MAEIAKIVFAAWGRHPSSYVVRDAARGMDQLPPAVLHMSTQPTSYLSRCAERGPIVPAPGMARPEAALGSLQPTVYQLANGNMPRKRLKKRSPTVRIDSY